MQLDVFEALWELYQPSRHRPRPAAESTSSERLATNGAHSLLEVSIEAVVWRDFIDHQGRIQHCRVEAYDYKIPYWRVRHADEGRIRLTRTEIELERDTSL